MQEAVRAYLDVINETIPREKMVAESYRRLILTIEDAKAAISKSNYELAHEKLALCQEAMIYLSGSLNKAAGELALNLEKLYHYIHGLLVKGNVYKDIAPLDEATKLLGILLEGWEKIGASP